MVTLLFSFLQEDYIPKKQIPINSNDELLKILKKSDGDLPLLIF